MKEVDRILSHLLDPHSGRPQHKIVNGEAYCVYPSGLIYRLRDGRLMELCLDGSLTESNRPVQGDQWPDTIYPDILDADVIGDE